MTTPVLQIDKGVIFEGRSFMEGFADKQVKKPEAVIVNAAPPPPAKPVPQQPK